MENPCCSQNVIKIALYITNITFLIFAIIIIATTTTYSLTRESKFKINDEKTYSFGMGGGYLLLFIPLLAIVGLFFDLRLLLLIYAIIMFILFIICIIGAIGLLIFAKVVSDVKFDTEAITQFIDNYNHDEDVKEAVDNMQEMYTCCGINGVKDWKDKIPSSCCTKENNPCTKENAYKEGCIHIIRSYSSKTLLMIGSLVLVAAIISLASGILAAVFLRPGL